MRKVIIPISLRAPLTLVDGVISVTALIFVASGFSPSGVSVFPMYGISLHRSLILSLLSFIDFSTHLFKRASSYSKVIQELLYST